MAWYNWLIVIVPFIFVIWMAFYSRKYIRDVVDFLAADRVCGFKKAKQLLHGGELFCCHESATRSLRTVSQNARNNVTRVEISGFPSGPYSTECSG